MLDEFDADQAADRLYRSSYQSPAGLGAWPELLRNALAEHDEAWLTRAASPSVYRLSRYRRRKPKGGYTWAQVPYTASATLSESQFVCYYLRAVCRRAQEDGLGTKVVRMQQVETPRAHSLALIGQPVDPTELLEDLRLNMAIENFFGIPGGPNSGIGVEIVGATQPVADEG